MHRFDLLVIGSGAAGSTIASKCRAAGWEVAVIDERPFGGTCALRGCDPKKVLVGLAELADWSRRMLGKGIRGESLGVDWPALMRFKRSFTATVPARTEEKFAQAGIRAFHGPAKFAGPATLSVEGDRLEGRYVVIASGAKPVKLGIPGEDLLTYSDGFMELDILPKRIVFVGGGFVSFEFAHVAARAGAKVSIVHRAERALNQFEPGLVRRLESHTRELGVDLLLQTSVDAVSRASGGLMVTVNGPGGERRIEADLVVHGAGRTAAIDDLDLDSGGVERVEHGGIKVNRYLQSESNPAVYAAGDAVEGGPPLTPLASYDGEVVARNLLNGNQCETNYDAVASVVFTIPPLASVGFTEEAATARGLRFRVLAGDTADWYSYRRIGAACSGYQLLVEDGTERILGAHLLGFGAEETINVFALAMRNGISAGELKKTFFAYPTHASDIGHMIS